VVDTWVEAKTKGICPLIEFTDKNDTKWSSFQKLLLPDLIRAPAAKQVLEL
jgi:hypothetical protein